MAKCEAELSLTDADALINFLIRSTQLKRTVRTGWTRYNIQQPESVADHSWRVALISLLVSSHFSSSKSQIKCIKMGLVHDLAESIIGDITPYCNVSKAEKHVKEKAAMETLCRLFHSGALKATGDELMQLWMEYEEGLTAEARLVKDIDKYEMLQQAYEYELYGNIHGGGLQNFFDNTICFFQTNVGITLSRRLEERRHKFLDNPRLLEGAEQEALAQRTWPKGDRSSSPMTGKNVTIVLAVGIASAFIIWLKPVSFTLNHSR